MLKIGKRVFSERIITFLKKKLSLLYWRNVDVNGNANGIYVTFLTTLIDICGTNLPIPEYILKDKDIKSPWTSKVQKKFSKKAKIVH